VPAFGFLNVGSAAATWKTHPTHAGLCYDSNVIPLFHLQLGITMVGLDRTTLHMVLRQERKTMPETRMHKRNTEFK
jgi:hypothetical protein